MFYIFFLLVYKTGANCANVLTKSGTGRFTDCYYQQEYDSPILRGLIEY